MWVKMTSEEHKTARRGVFCERLFLTLGLFVMCFVLSFVYVMSGFASIYGPVSQPNNLDEFIQNLPGFLLTAFMLFVIVEGIYLWRLIRTPKPYVCEACQERKVDDGSYECNCGGKFEPLACMKWVEEDSI